MKISDSVRLNSTKTVQHEDIKSCHTLLLMKRGKICYTHKQTNKLVNKPTCTICCQLTNHPTKTVFLPNVHFIQSMIKWWQNSNKMILSVKRLQFPEVAAFGLTANLIIYELLCPHWHLQQPMSDLVDLSPVSSTKLLFLFPGARTFPPKIKCKVFIFSYVDSSCFPACRGSCRLIFAGKKVKNNSVF